MKTFRHCFGSRGNKRFENSWQVHTHTGNVHPCEFGCFMRSRSNLSVQCVQLRPFYGRCLLFFCFPSLGIQFSLFNIRTLDSRRRRQQMYCLTLVSAASAHCFWVRAERDAYLCWFGNLQIYGFSLRTVTTRRGEVGTGCFGFSLVPMSRRLKVACEMSPIRGNHSQMWTARMGDDQRPDRKRSESDVQSNLVLSWE